MQHFTKISEEQTKTEFYTQIKDEDKTNKSSTQSGSKNGRETAQNLLRRRTALRKLEK